MKFKKGVGSNLKYKTNNPTYPSLTIPKYQMFKNVVVFLH